jgi:hypothetical protein
MKSKILTGLLMVMAIFLFSCSKDEKKSDETTIPTVTKKYLISTVKLNDFLYEEGSYDTSGKLIKYVNHGGEPQMTFYIDITYNTNGSIKEMKSYKNSVLDQTITVESNSDNKPIKFTIRGGDTNGLIFDYDANKRVTKINYYNGGTFDISNMYGYVVLTYNTGSNVAKEVFYELPADKRYEYDFEYDAKNSLFTVNEILWLYYSVYWDNDGMCYLFSRNNVTKSTFATATPPEVTDYVYEYNTDGYPTKLTVGGDVYTMTYIVK